MKKLILSAILIIGLIFGYQAYKYRYLLQSVDNYIPEKLIEYSDESLKAISLPENFIIKYYAKNIPGARSMTKGADGMIYVGSRQTGKVYALNKEKQIFTIAENLNSPNGVAWHEGNLYVAEINRILLFRDIDKTYADKPQFEVFYDKMSENTHHGWRYIAIGPDNKLYVPFGAPCNICQTEGTEFATINSIDLSSKEFKVIAKGIRNTVGFDWHPETNQLYFTDNGRDWVDDNTPADELNVINTEEEHFGFPYCHAKEFKDPDFGKSANCNQYTPALVELGPHVAALGMKFYTKGNFPEIYKNRIFIAEHGSWNRKNPIGYRITLVDPTTKAYTTFAEGWLNENGKAWGRPVDILVTEEGSLLVSDDLNNAIYEIKYTK